MKASVPPQAIFASQFLAKPKYPNAQIPPGGKQWRIRLQTLRKVQYGAPAQPSRLVFVDRGRAGSLTCPFLEREIRLAGILRHGNERDALYPEKCLGSLSPRIEETACKNEAQPRHLSGLLNFKVFHSRNPRCLIRAPGLRGLNLYRFRFAPETSKLTAALVMQQGALSKLMHRLVR